MPKSKFSLLASPEQEILNAVFALGNRASGDDTRARLVSPPSDSAVRVMLARLEKKGALRHEQDGPRYLYSATTSPASAKKSALRQYLGTFFGGSLKQMITSLIAEASWTDQELEDLSREIRRVRSERNRRT